MATSGKNYDPYRMSARGKKFKIKTEVELEKERFRNSKRWKNTRLSKLSYDPLCQYPGCIRPASDVHHVITLDEEYPYFKNGLTYSNLRSLCKFCHAKISNMENNGKERQAKEIFTDE